MDYKYIRAWGQMLGSFPSYIEGEVERAKRDRAPQTATYRRQDGSWATFEQVVNKETRNTVATIVKQMQQEDQRGKASD